MSGVIFYFYFYSEANFINIWKTFFFYRKSCNANVAWPTKSCDATNFQKHAGNKNIKQENI